MKLFQVDNVYEQTYTQGWDARMCDLFVNPYFLDFETNRYEAWKHGWEDADIELEVDNGSQVI